MGGSVSNEVAAKDVVILHQFPRSTKIPSASPFVLKLETWIRMNKLEYKNSFGLKFSSKGKMPWIELNGKEHSDSQFIIEHLSKHFGINMNEHLSEMDKSMARAYLKLTEDSLFWCMAIHRYILGPSVEDSGLSQFMLFVAARIIRKQSNGHGYGRHSKEEIYRLGKADLKALSTFLGEKKFLFGEKPCDLDASVFAMVAEILYTERGPFYQYVKSDCQNLERYVENIKQLYWPDWNECLKKQ